MVEGGITLVKYMLFIANFILWVFGLGLVIVGTVLQFRYTGMLDVLGDERLATPVIFLAAGCLCSLLGFLGYCGAIRENYCLTVSFAVLLALFLLVEVAIVIAAYALHEPLHNALINQLTDGLKRYTHSKGVAIAWDQTQKELNCCGVNNSSDWQQLIPDSCCVHFYKGCAQIPKPLLHQTGCVQSFKEWILKNVTIVASFGVLLGTMQVFGICFACCLSKSILKDFHDFYY